MNSRALWRATDISVSLAPGGVSVFEERPSPGSRSKTSRESGYAYLMALFMVLVVIVGSSVAVESILTTGRRQREDEVIWRGNQYVRAIRLYYRKTGHYPQSLEDLEKGQPQLHFLRYAAYKDPMNKDDGAWRLIYVNAAGQIIGSVRYATLQQMALIDLNGGQGPCVQQGPKQGLGTPASSVANSSTGGTSTNCQASQNSTSAQSPSSQSSPTQSPSTPSTQTGQSASSPQSGLNLFGGQQGAQMGADGQPLANPLLALKPTGPVTGPVLGGFVTGVGSTIDKTSQKIYKGGRKYNEWEFIWNPLEDQAAAMQQGLNPGQTGLPGQPGQAIGTGAAGTSIFGGIGANGPNGSNGPNGATGAIGGSGTAPTNPNGSTTPSP